MSGCRATRTQTCVRSAAPPAQARAKRAVHKKFPTLETRLDSPPELTDEQSAVVSHDPNKHATVLAVAGSGKTTTMVYRVQHLLRARDVHPSGLRVVMFNRDARRAFEEKLSATGITNVRVQTFHAMGYALVRWAIERGLLPQLEVTSEDGQVWSLLYDTIAEARRCGALEPGDLIDAQELLDAIGTWKSMLTPPSRARHADGDAWVELYRIYEEIRTSRNILTFDDQLFESVRLLETQPTVREHLSNRLDHIIIDEYQDINFAQERMIRLLAGERARVMVVGDDDQCIYEWRGARSSFIRGQFQRDFDTAAHQTYTLSATFRFGHRIAACAAAVTSMNTQRVEKRLVPGDAAKGGVVREVSDAGRRLLELLDSGVSPRDVVVLVRAYHQSSLIQAQLLGARIPYIVDGGQHLGQQDSVRTALLYLELAAALHTPLSAELGENLHRAFYRPPRYVKGAVLRAVLRQAIAQGATVDEALSSSHAFEAHGAPFWSYKHVRAFRDTLRKLWRCKDDAARALARVRADVDLATWVAESRGDDDAARWDLELDAISEVLKSGSIGIQDATAFVASLDTQRGAPESSCVRITSIFRSKGLEWDHVVIPQLAQGTFPDLRASAETVSDRSFPERTRDATPVIESERRLFYVALTRAKVAAYIEPADGRFGVSPFVMEASVDVVDRALDAIQACVDNTRMPRGSLGAMKSVARLNGAREVIAHALDAARTRTSRDRRDDLAKLQRAFDGAIPASKRGTPSDTRPSKA